MRAPLAAAAASFAAGILCGWWLHLPLFAVLFSSGVVFLFAVRPGRRRSLFLLILFTLLGAGRAALDEEFSRSAVFRFLTEEARPVTCEGVIVSGISSGRPAGKFLSRRGRLRIISLSGPAGTVPVSGVLLVHLPGVGPPLEYGDRVLLTGMVRRPRTLSSKGFREADWFWSEGLSGLLNISDPAAVRRLSTEPGVWVRYCRLIGAWRAALKARGRLLMETGDAVYLEALLLGEAGGIPRRDWDLFRATGTVHILVVSGLHVSLIAFLILVLASLFRVSRMVRFLMMVFGLVVYCTLTGSEPSILRATLMGLLTCLGAIFGSGAFALNGLGLSGFLILWADPRALASVSFQLSFSAVLGLLVIAPWFEKKAYGFLLGEGKPGVFWEVFLKGLSASVAAWAATAPLIFWHFKMVSPVAVAANMVLVPWSTVLIFIGCAVYLFGSVSLIIAAPFAAVFSLNIKNFIVLTILIQKVFKAVFGV